MHALGATRGQIARAFFAEALVLSLIAAALGLAGGLGMARVLLLKGVTTLGTGHRIVLFDVPLISTPLYHRVRFGSLLSTFWTALALARLTL